MNMKKKILTGLMVLASLVGSTPFAQDIYDTCTSDSPLAMQEGFSAIPRASNPDYIKENIEIFDFELTDGEMTQMRSLNKEERFFNMSLEEKERAYLGKMQIPTNK